MNGARDIGDHPKRGAILRLARAAFIEEGFAGAKVEPIARDAGVSTATLYGLFKGKSELFDAVIADASDDFARQFSNLNACDGDARAQLTAFAHGYARFMGDPFVRSVFRLVMAERPRFRGVALRFFEKGRSDIGGTLIAMLNRLSARGELLPLDHPSHAAGQLMGMIEHPVFFVPLVTGGEVTMSRTGEDVADGAVATFLACYGAQG